MCDPLSLAAASTAIAATSAIAGFQGASQMAKANASAANLSYANTQNQIGAKGVQVDQAQSENTAQATIDRAAAEGRISAGAASVGADASTTARGVNAADFAANRGLAIEDINTRNQRLGLAQSSTNAWYSRQSQINEHLAPSPLALAIQLAGAGFQGVSSFASFGGQLPGMGASGAGAGGGSATDLSGMSPVDAAAMSAG